MIHGAAMGYNLFAPPNAVGVIIHPYGFGDAHRWGQLLNAVVSPIINYQDYILLLTNSSSIKPTDSALSLAKERPECVPDLDRYAACASRWCCGIEYSFQRSDHELPPGAIAALVDLAWWVEDADPASSVNHACLALGPTLLKIESNHKILLTRMC